MGRAAARLGDPTTTRGRIISASSTMFDNRKQIALHGDLATCGNCEGSFKIYATGTGMSENGRQVALHGDPILCRCKNNKVMVYNDPGVFNSRDQGASQTVNTTSQKISEKKMAEIRPDSIAERNAGQRIQFLNSETAEFLSNRKFIAVVDGVRKQGITDRMGFADLDSVSGSNIRIHLVFESSTGNLKYQ